MSDDSKQVRSIRISLEGIAKAESTGGDFGLTPLTAANRDTVKNIDLTTKKATWAVKPDRLPKSKKRITSKPIALPLGKFHEVEFSLTEGARMAAMTSTHPDDTDRSRRYTARDAKDRRFHLSIHNLMTGSQTRSIDVPSNSKLLAVSPSGKFAAVRAAGDGNRLDVWSLDDGQHQFAWNPYVANLALKPTRYSAIPPKPYAVHWVQFVDDEHVLTRDSGNSVNGKTECNYVMWKIPECTAIYKITRIERDFRFGTARLTPGREYLVISEGNGFHFLDSRSGELRGTLEFPPNCIGSIGRFAIHPNGKRFLATLIRRGNGTSRSERVLTAWDLEQSNMLLQFRTPISIAVGNLNWIPTSSHLVLAGYHLLDLDRCAVIWTYNASYWQGPTSAPDDRKWIIVEGIGMSGPQLSWVRPVELRHAAAEQLAARKMPNGPITVVGPGSKITLQIGSMPGTDADFAQKVREC